MPLSRTAELLSRVARLIAADGYDRGLKPVQWQALRFLAAANRFSRTPGGLTAYLGQTKGSVSQTVAALTAKGLVERSSDEADQRIVRLNLTQAGSALVDARPLPVAEDLLNALNSEERLAFGQLIDLMLQSSLAKRGHRPFGICATCHHFQKRAGNAGANRCGLLKVDLTNSEAQEICIEHNAFLPCGTARAAAQPI
jgi:DNA-binding MarR family transcriptional regulator